MFGEAKEESSTVLPSIAIQYSSRIFCLCNVPVGPALLKRSQYSRLVSGTAKIFLAHF